MMHSTFHPVYKEEAAVRDYVDLSREAYEHLAENLTSKAHEPAEAMRLAHNAMQYAIRRAEARAPCAAGVRWSA